VSGPVRHAGPACTLATALMLGLPPALAADGDPLVRQQLEQKIKLTASLMADSPAAQRIDTSGNVEAVGHLNEGRVHHALAVDLLAQGDLSGARRAVDDALRHLGMARRMVPDAQARQALLRQRHEQLLGSVERLLESWRARGAGQPGDDGAEMTAAMGLIGGARGHAQAGRFDEANQALAQAERHVLTGMNRSLHATTLDYTVRPTSVIEAFQFELARHKGFADLLPLAVRDLKPNAEASALIDRYAETSHTLQAQAELQAQAGKPEEALALIRNATLYIQRALLAAGLVSPQPTGTTP
jgi:tetratricopeptide (TPR) repeat protein